VKAMAVTLIMPPSYHPALTALCQEHIIGHFSLANGH
jgi:hypothetical protein